MTLRLGWFSSGRGPGSRRLLATGHAEIASRPAGAPAPLPPGGAGSQRPRRGGGPLPEWRRDFDREVIRLLEPYAFDTGMLAGYMLIGTELLCGRYDLLHL